MKLIKYDRAKDSGASGTTIINSTTSSSSDSGNVNPSTRGDNIARIVWGQNDDGVDDIDGSMAVNGNVTIKAIVPPTYDDVDDGSDGEDIEEETGGGNLDVEVNIHAGKEVSSESVKASKDITSPEVYGKKVFLDRNNIKTNVLDLINDHESRINQNKTDIAALNGRVSSAESNINKNKTDIAALNGRVSSAELRITKNETDIAALGGRVSTAESNITTINNNITTINGDIDDIKTRLDNLGSGGGGSAGGEGGLTESQVNDMIYKAVHYPIATPVVLVTGEIHSNNNDNDKTWQPWFGSNLFKHGFVKDCYISYVSKGGNIPALKITFDFNPDYDVRLSAVSAMVLEATDWNAYDHAANYNARGKGYWCTGGVKDQAVYLEAWRTADSNNDSVRFDCIAHKIKQINITVTGYAYLKNP